MQLCMTLLSGKLWELQIITNLSSLVHIDLKTESKCIFAHFVLKKNKVRNHNVITKLFVWNSCICILSRHLKDNMVIDKSNSGLLQTKFKITVGLNTNGWIEYLVCTKKMQQISDSLQNVNFAVRFMIHKNVNFDSLSCLIICIIVHVYQVIYFPDHWWHGTLNLDASVFISTFLG